MAVLLRDRYDIGEQIAGDPLVQVIDDFVGTGECKHIINLAKAKMKRGRVTLDDEVAYSEGRTGRTAWIAHDATPIVRKLVRRVSDIVHVPTTHAESLQIVHYAATQEYKPHRDAWKVGTDRHRKRTENGGQRLVTALMYLNEVEAGGGTSFPKLELEVEPIPGRIVIFHNATGRNNDVHKNSLHGGMTVHHGEKWACNLWFRELPYRRAGRRQAVNSKKHAMGSTHGSSKKNRKSQKAARRKNR